HALVHQVLAAALLLQMLPHACGTARGSAMLARLGLGRLALAFLRAGLHHRPILGGQFAALRLDLVPAALLARAPITERPAVERLALRVQVLIDHIPASLLRRLVALHLTARALTDHQRRGRPEVASLQLLQYIVE